MNYFKIPKLPKTQKPKQYFFTTSENDYHKDITLISIANAIFTVAIMENTEDLGIFVIDKEKYKDEIKMIDEQLASFIKQYHFLINGLKQRELANVQKIKDISKKIYTNILVQEKFHKNFNLEMFAVNILFARFTEQRRKPNLSLSYFMDKQRLKTIIDTTSKCTNIDDFENEYEAATLLCKQVQEIKL